jgi:hypothetical protein
MFFRKVCFYLRVYTASQPRRKSLSSPPSEPQISYTVSSSVYVASNDRMIVNWKRYERKLL